MQMKDHRTYYEILHVQPDAPVDIVRSSYRTLMQNLNAHPDRGGDSAEAALINRAYAVLTDARKRADYDCELQLQTPLDLQAEASVETLELLALGVCLFCGHAHQYQDDIPPDSFCSICASPLCPADRARVDQSDKRRVERTGKQTSLSWYTDWPQQRPHDGVMANLSPHGLMFTAAREVAVESRIKIDCAQLTAIVQVQNCRRAGGILRRRWHIGGKFLTIRFSSPSGVFVSDTA